jgi:hypothetical protein
MAGMGRPWACDVGYQWYERADLNFDTEAGVGWTL